MAKYRIGKVSIPKPRGIGVVVEMPEIVNRGSKVKAKMGRGEVVGRMTIQKSPKVKVRMGRARIKARKILNDGEIRGKKLTNKQTRYFHAVAGVRD